MSREFTISRGFHVARKHRSRTQIQDGVADKPLAGRIPRVARVMALAIRCEQLIRDGMFDGSSRDDSRVGWKVPWEDAVVLSLDAATGAVRWKGKRGESRVGHVTPILVDNETQIVSAGGDRVQGFDARTGQRIWSIYSQGEGVTPLPLAGFCR